MIVYVGPTMYGIATRNTVYSEIPAALAAEIESRPFLRDLCISVQELPGALQQIREKRGFFYTLYQKAMQ